MLQQEVNAIGRTYQRAGFLPDPARGEVRALLRGYVDARVEWAGPGELGATTIWLALYLVAVLSMAAIGYHAGVTGTTRSPAGVAVVLSFAVIMLLIADLDRPREGLLSINQQPLVVLQQSLHAR